MRERIVVSLALALLGAFASTGIASAALLEDQDDVMIATGIVALALMGVLFVFYMLKRAFGLVHGLPPETDAGDAHH
jgi:hypothetical protein